METNVSMDILPNDVLLEIISYLPQHEIMFNVRKVCIRWAELSFWADLWHTIDLAKYKKDRAVQEAMIANIKQIQDHVKILTVDPHLLQTIFANDVWQFLTLKQLNLTSLQGQARSIFTEPCLKYPRLQKVSFHANAVDDLIPPPAHALSIDTLSWKHTGSFSRFRTSVLTMNEMHNLQKIKIHVKDIDNESLNYLLRNCKYLTSLEMISYNVNLTDEAFISLPDKKTLTKFELPYASITDTALKRISESCPNIRAINISRCKNITDIGIEYLVKNCLNLQDISLNYIPSLTKQSLCIITNNCPGLKVLNARCHDGIEDETISTFLLKCSKLVKLDISFCKNITNGWLLFEFSGFLTIEVFPSFLQDIHLSGNKKITAEVVMRILTSFKFLQNISLVNCISIRGLDLQYSEQTMLTNVSTFRQSLSTCGSIPHSHLLSVNLNNSYNVEDSTLIHLSELCPDLRSIKIMGCVKITTHILPTVFRNCRFVEKIEQEKHVYPRSICN